MNLRFCLGRGGTGETKGQGERFPGSPYTQGTMPNTTYLDITAHEDQVIPFLGFSFVYNTKHFHELKQLRLTAIYDLLKDYNASSLWHRLAGETN